MPQRDERDQACAGERDRERPVGNRGQRGHCQCNNPGHPRGIAPGDQAPRDDDEEDTDDKCLSATGDAAVHRRGEAGQPGVRSYGCEKVHATDESHQCGDQTYTCKPHEATLAISK